MPGEMAIDSGDVTAGDSSLERKQRETWGGVGSFQAEGTAEAEALQWDSLHHRHHPHSPSHPSGPPMSHWEGILVYFQVLLWNVSFLKAGPGPYVLSDTDQHLAQSCPSLHHICWDFSGSPVVKTLRLYHRGHRLDPWLRN